MAEFTTESLLDLLKEKVEDGSGALFLNDTEDKVFVTGEVRSDTVSQKEVENFIRAAIKKWFPDKKNKIEITVRPKDQFVVSVNDSDDEVTVINEAPDELGEIKIDQVEVLYAGELPVKALKKTDRFKTPNREALRKVEPVISVFGYTDPVVVDQNLEIIDGNMRVSIALERLRDKKTTKTTIPVIVLNTTKAKADFLTLALNRSAEFPRWTFRNIDAYIDTVPQLQPLLEPLGFFGERILPVSFFGPTVINYRLDPYNKQQQTYKQEYGLAKWAEIMRERKKKEQELKALSITDPADENTQSLMDLKPKDEDFIKTTETDSLVKEYLNDLTEDAERITEIADEISRKEKAEKGEEWQPSRRSSEQVIADRRRKAEEELRKAEQELKDSEDALESADTDEKSQRVAKEAVDNSKAKVQEKTEKRKRAVEDEEASVSKNTASKNTAEGEGE